MNTKLLFLLVISLIVGVSFCMPTPTLASTEADAAAKLTATQKQAIKDERVVRLQAYLAHHNSTLAQHADVFVREADRYKLDWRLVAAIAGKESTFGRFIPPGSYNGWGWGIPTGAQSGIGFRSWEEGIATVSRGLREDYYDRGAVTIEDVGRKYAASPAWPSGVRFFLNAIEEYKPLKSEALALSL